MKKVEQPGFDRLALIDAEIAQDVVHFSEAGGLILAAAAIRHLQPLARMRVEKRQHAFGCPPHRRRVCTRWHQRRCGRDTKTEKRTPGQMRMRFLVLLQADISCGRQSSRSDIKGRQELSHGDDHVTSSARGREGRVHLARPDSCSTAGRQRADIIRQF